MLQLFSNGRFYTMMLAIFIVVCVTILSALGKIDTTTTSVILTAIIAGAIGHVNGVVQGSQETLRRFTNGPPLDPPKEGE
jgi:fumarate reductase subunit D